MRKATSVPNTPLSTAMGTRCRSPLAPAYTVCTLRPHFSSFINPNRPTLAQLCTCSSSFRGRDVTYATLRYHVLRQAYVGLFKVVQPPVACYTWHGSHPVHRCIRTFEHTKFEASLLSGFAWHSRSIASASSCLASYSPPFRSLLLQSLAVNLNCRSLFHTANITFLLQLFSSLERLRFASNSEHNEPVRTRPSLADRRGVKSPLVDSSRHSNSTHRPRKLVRRRSSASNETSWFLTLPDKIQRREVADARLFGGRGSDSFEIYDAADENIRKAGRRNRGKGQHPRGSLDIMGLENEAIGRPSSASREMFDSFRWMDEEEDLDLRLVLDDYHANVDGAVIPLPHTSHPQRPSFRRHMSITKSPFGRGSLSSNQSPRPSISDRQMHRRDRSKTLSLAGPLTSRHIAKDSVSSIDAHATHYQDPEARLKLRVYLASPQKFDEALEFGFPSLEADASRLSEDKENHTQDSNTVAFHGNKSPVLSHDSATFLNDDTVSLSSSTDEPSIIDPDSPLTPAELHDATFRNTSSRPSFNVKRSMSSSHDYSHLGIKKPIIHRPTESIAQQIAGSREMTLRMTLTRPDLRADEAQLYGWQEKERPIAKSPLTDEPLASSMASSERIEKFGLFGGVDGWGPLEKEEGVVKRFWNKVKSGSKKSM